MLRLDGRRIYVDSNAFIYFSEDHPIFADVVEDLFVRAKRGTISLVTSELTLAEVLVLPLRKQDKALEAQYAEVISPRPYLDVVPVRRSVLLMAARLRAEHGLKLPDAIHMATAVEIACDVFLSEDKGIRGSPDLERIRLSELQASR